MSEDLKSKWTNMSPKKKRAFALSGVLAAFLLVAMGSDMLFTPKKKDKAQDESVSRNVLTDTNTRQLGIDGLAASVQRLRREVSDLSTTVSKYIESQDSLQRNRNLDLDKEISSLKKEIREMKVQAENSNSQLRQDMKKVGQTNGSQKQTKERPAKEPKEPKARSSSSGSSFVREQSSGSNTGIRSTTELFQSASSAPSASSRQYEDEEEEVVEKSKPMKIHVINAAPPEKVKREAARKIRDNKKAETKEIEFYMPTGSIISAMLLNGIDASTSTSARSEPMPALLRVEKEAILPNRFTSDIKDCFVLVSGHGDLSSERAYLRGEYLSCVRNDGAVLETKFPSYVVGEDGKAGMKGRLVSKQGQMLARSMVAGFASGISKAFDVTPVSVLDTTSIGGSVQYQNNFSSGLVRGAAAQGASQALERIADFYIKMAEQIFPVVEITAGRRIDIVVTNGTKLRLKNMNELSDTAKSTPTVQPNSVITMRENR